MKKSIFAGAAIITLFFLLTYPTLAFQGASQGLLLWFHTVLPTLLPFMLCSNAIVMFHGIPLLTWPLRPLFHRFLHLSQDGCYVLIAGLLCGYPMGAKTCSEFLRDRRISLPEAKYLFAICNHPSPMFLLGYVGSRLSESIPVSRIILSLYLPIFPLSWIAGKWYEIRNPLHLSDLGQQENKFPLLLSQATFPDMIMSSFEVMVRIGGYIMIFSVLGAYIQNLISMPLLLKGLFLGLVEITTGIQLITQTLSGTVQGLLVVFITAFGGLSGIFQTMAVKNAGLSIRHYILWKCIHTLLSSVLYLALTLFS